MTALKETFGFLERDPKFGEGEIFFHYSEVEGDVSTLRIGTDLTYSETKQGNKPRAVSVKVDTKCCICVYAVVVRGVGSGWMLCGWGLRIHPLIHSHRWTGHLEAKSCVVTWHASGTSSPSSLHAQVPAGFLTRFCGVKSL